MYAVNFSVLCMQLILVCFYIVMKLKIDECEENHGGRIGKQTDDNSYSHAYVIRWNVFMKEVEMKNEVATMKSF